MEAANLGTNRRAEVGMRDNDRAFDAMQKIARGIGFETKMDGPIVLLIPFGRDIGGL